MGMGCENRARLQSRCQPHMVEVEDEAAGEVSRIRQSIRKRNGEQFGHCWRGFAGSESGFGDGPDCEVCRSSDSDSDFDFGLVAWTAVCEQQQAVETASADERTGLKGIGSVLVRFCQVLQHFQRRFAIRKAQSIRRFPL